MTGEFCIKNGIALADWLDAHGQKRVTLAKTLGITPPLVSLWLAGRRTPSAPLRSAIERWTSGAIAASAWLEPAELARERRLARVRAAR